jgi:hypothetical protein
MNNNMVVLPISGDLWSAPVYDEAGNIVPRADTLDLRGMPAPAKMTPDQAAMLFAQVQNNPAAGSATLPLTDPTK